MADSSGEKISAPGVCFMIPPPDAEAIALADQYVPPSLPCSTLLLPQQTMPSSSPAPGHPTNTAPCTLGSGSADRGLLPQIQ